MKNGKRKASAKQDFVVGSFSRRERSIRGKEDKKRGEEGEGALETDLRRERKRERGRMTPSPKQASIRLCDVKNIWKIETKQDETSFTES